MSTDRPVAEPAEHRPAIDVTTPEGQAIDALYHRIRGGIETSCGDWNGVDVVEAVAGMFHDLGYDLDAPYVP